MSPKKPHLGFGLVKLLGHNIPQCRKVEKETAEAKDDKGISYKVGPQVTEQTQNEGVQSHEKDEIVEIKEHTKDMEKLH